jgi:hypothetical protein
MGYMVRQPPATAKLRDEHLLNALATAMPFEVVRGVLTDLAAGRQRTRKLPAELTLLLPVGMALFPREAIERVLVKLLQGLRFIWPGPALEPATKSAICQARYQLGARPLARLFHRVCRPLATPETPGAFLFGLRLVALDGTTEAVPDTPANRGYFGGPANQRGPASFPHVRGVYLIECGTHAILDAGFWPYHVGERVGGRRVLRSVTPGMLVLWDMGFHSADLIGAVTARGAHVLGRVPSYVHLPVYHRLADGSYLCRLSTGKDWQRPRQPHQLVRVIEYTLTDPNRPGVGERHRLITTLLDPAQAPALDLVCAYHERWEIELVIDEHKTHLRLLQHPLRSHKPAGILQELYGLLLAHFAIRTVMAEAAAQVHLDPRRLSFVQAVQLVGDALAEFQMVVPDQRSALYQRLLTDIGRHPLPPRANRLNPRVLKYRRAKYPPKRPHHRRWPQPTMSFRNAVAMLI